jgi:hypothetical protein
VASKVAWCGVGETIVRTIDIGRSETLHLFEMAESE